MGIFDSIKAKLQNTLEDTQRRLEAKIGTFLTTGQTIADMRTRAQQFQNSDKADVVSRAKAIVAKANGLLAQYASLKDSAGNLVSKILALKANVQSNPAFNFTDTENMGTRITEIINTTTKSVMGTAGDALNLLTSLDKHIRDTNGLVSDVRSLDSYAQGKGFSALVDRAESGIGSTTQKVAVVATLGVLGYVLLPSLLGRLMRAGRG
jgi:hypothetical protein